MKKRFPQSRAIALATAAFVAGAAVFSLQSFGQAGGGTGDGAAPGTGGVAPGRGGRGRGFQALVDPNANLTNLATVASASTSFVSGDQTIDAINDGVLQATRNGPPLLHYGSYNRRGTNWVEYTWPKPISTNKADVIWWSDNGGMQFPAASRIKYWDGSQLVEVPNAKGLGVAGNAINTTSFDEVTTTRIRLEFDASANGAVGINEFRVFDSGKSPALPPIVHAGIDRDVVLKGKTYLTGSVRSSKSGGLADTPVQITWSKESGPGDASFAGASDVATTASFDKPGEYVLLLTAKQGDNVGTDKLHVRVDAEGPESRLEPVQTSTYKIDSPLWSPRLKAQITTWIPHVVDFLEHEDKHPRIGPGGLDNFIEAGKKLRGEPAARHIGYPFANAYVHNTVEAMCEALMYDPQGDQEIIKAQNDMRATLDRWIPIILAAQEPDGYIQTRFTLNGGNHWDPATRGEHEGYTQGYFLESAIAHYNMTGGKDKTMYNAAKKCADCWVANIGPGKKVWFDGHQEMENALVRFSRLVDQVDGPGKGQPYVELAKFLLDSRSGGSSYDQSNIPVVQQYEAEGHAVRAAYTYTGMASVAAEFHNPDYESATLSLWDNIINKKIYITGGIGSGDTSEGFGADYSLRNNAYCESCANCGELFFQYNMLLNYHDAKYVDSYEDTLYNAILGDNNLSGTLFEYTNPLSVSGPRENWDGCPCCVSNIPRTLLQLPTWTYSMSNDSIFVNLFVGGTMTVNKFQGTSVEMVQKTNYPWDGKVAITVNPKESKTFTLRVRVPDRQVGDLYANTPAVKGITSLAVNGEAIADPKIEKGYALITRDWKAGDKVEFNIPLAVQRAKANNNLVTDRGRVALRYGPLVYNVEAVDGNSMSAVLSPDAPLTTEWKADLLDGVVVIKGKWADGSDLVAIPNFTRNNRQPAAAGGGRGGRGGGGVFSQVWMFDNAEAAAAQPAGRGARGTP